MSIVVYYIACIFQHLYAPGETRTPNIKFLKLEPLPIGLPGLNRQGGIRTHNQFLARNFKSRCICRSATHPQCPRPGSNWELLSLNQVPLPIRLRGRAYTTGIEPASLHINSMLLATELRARQIPLESNQDPKVNGLRRYHYARYLSLFYINPLC